MARPLKPNLEYFNHKVNASHDNKIEQLEYRFKNDGYAVFFKILEKLYNDNGKFNLKTDAEFEIYGAKWHVGTDRLKEIISYMREISLFPRNNFLSKSVKEKLNRIETERERKRNYYKNKIDSQEVLDVQNTGETPPLPSKEKKRKEKKSIEKTAPHLFSDSPYFEFDIFRDKFYSNEDYTKFDVKFYYEKIKNWSGENGKKKADWILTARNWALGDWKEDKAKLVDTTNGLTLEEQYAKIEADVMKLTMERGY